MRASKRYVVIDEHFPSVNEFGTFYYRNHDAGFRHELRKPPLFMIMNLHNGVCWCGKSFKWPKRKYCSNEHADWWFYYIRSYWASFRLEVIRAWNYTCVLCGRTREGDTSYFEVDHELAIINGGMCFDTENVRPLCIECHKKKTAKDIKLMVFKRKKLTSLDGYCK